jgi:hypothetical protein
VLAWALTLPLVGASVLAGHGIAYRVTGAQPGPLHDYLQHAPQVLALLVVAALLGLALEPSAGGVRTRTFALLGVVVFAAQEHLERFLHDGSPPLLLDEPAFLLGLALQVPVGLLAVWVARRLVHIVRAAGGRADRPPLPSLLPLVSVPFTCALAPVARPADRPRRSRSPERRRPACAAP